MGENKKIYWLRSAAIMVFGLILIVFLGVTDYITGREISISVFYLAPILLITWNVSGLAGIFMSIVGAITWFISDYTGSHYSNFLIPYWNAFVRLGFFLTASYILSRLKIELDKEKEMARIDLLTGVNNSRAFYEIAKDEIERSRRHGHFLSIAYIDLDNFKAVNDTKGHSVGDSILRQVANVIKGSVRRLDVIARLGGDEFAVLLPETDEKTAARAIERIGENFLELMKTRALPITLSIGVVTFITPPDSASDMIKEADSLMYLAKNKGKNTVLHKKF